MAIPLSQVWTVATYVWKKKLAGVKRNHKWSHPMRPTTIGLDLAKNVFQVHAVTADGTVVFRRKTPPL